MFRNYLKVALRYLLKHKGYTAINVLGLAVGIAACLLILLFVRSEWSFDQQHSKRDRLYRPWLQEHYQGEVLETTSTPIPLGPVLARQVPEVEAQCRISDLNTQVQHGATSFPEAVSLVDENFFELFDFELLEGNRARPFPDKNSLIITQEAAKRYFGTTSAMGQQLQLQLGESRELFTITGIARDLPFESSIQFRLLIPFSNGVHFWSEQLMTSGWTNIAVNTYVLLQEGADPQAVDAKIATVLNPLVAKGYKPGEYNVRLQPLSDIRTNSLLPATIESPTNPLYAYILASVGLMILLIACINFVTLSVGRSATRALEVGVRKVMGADRRQLIGQFWGEALLLTLFSLLLGILLAYLFLPTFNQLANRSFTLQPDGFTLMACALLLLLIGLVAGSYPALVLSSFKPIQVLKGTLKTGGMGFFRRALIVLQFGASILMIICTLTIGQQLRYFQSKNLGFAREHILIVPTNLPVEQGNVLATRFIAELEKHPQVVGASRSLFHMANWGWMQLGYSDDQGAFRQFRFNAIDPSFVETMNLELVAGRNFMKGNAADSGSMLVNEALVREYGWQDPIGQKLPGAYPHRVIGVVKDFHFESLHNPIQPTAMALSAGAFYANSSDVSYGTSPRPRVSVKFRGGDPQAHIALLEQNWKAVAGDQEFEYVFLDDVLQRAYEQEQRLGSIVEWASFLSIFIACMGLFGLATLVVARRTKEIGIRKVLGANVGSIVALLSKEFMVLVGAAALLAFPLAWLLLNRWLQDFAYRIDVAPWVFAAAGLLVVGVALLTVSVQSVKAAMRNPVTSLRTE
ncbi:ABC transporter permease [Cesiribacter andamanensis]|uniref:Macrolide export ATP-binding/permease protein MacB n=1 Tax=Cesiribacter andamanensis AMV16 TaxID=1279009 RepID=M7N6A6_9BACT|nr:ABC transporter permease [Cesiribacter andamanensis]EMR02756.1 Macrolide export ATP-binding/permease protein MacB [Cesiribacter andamanensis AMV16]